MHCVSLSLAFFHSRSLIQQFRYAYYILSSFIVINAIITHYLSFVWVSLTHFLSYILLALIVSSLVLVLAFCLLSQFFNYIENIHQCSYLLQLNFTVIAVTMYVLCAIWAPVFNAVFNVNERIGMLKQSLLIESNIWFTLRKLLICVRCVFPRRTDTTTSFVYFFSCSLVIQLSPRYGNYNE